MKTITTYISKALRAISRVAKKAPLWGVGGLVIALAGCLKDDYSDCPRPATLIIKVEDKLGRDITPQGDVKQVIVFVFDENGNIVDAFELNEDEVKGQKPIVINFDPVNPPQSLTFSAWGNVGDKVDFANITDVGQLTDIYLAIKEQTDGFALSPDDIFYGSLTDIPVEFGTGSTAPHEVVIKRKSANVTITVTNLIEGGWDYTGTGNFHFVVTGTVHGIDHEGNYTESTAAYRPPAAFAPNGNFVAPLFNTLPTPEDGSLIVQIYYNNILIYIATTDSQGNPFTVGADETLNILINMPVMPEPPPDDGGKVAQVSVLSIISEWGVAHQWIKF